MIQVTVGNSHSKISGLTVKQEAGLRKELSYKVGSYFSGFGVARRSLLSRRGEFPSGLIYRVSDWLRSSRTYYARKDTRTYPRPEITLSKASEGAWEWQVRAVETAVKASRGVISAPTGTGKSRFMAMLIETLNLKTLVVVPSVELKLQLTADLAPFCKNVRVENIDNPELENLTDFDVLILEEYHRSAAKTYQRLNKKAWKDIYFRYGVTATNFRSDEEETMLLESIASRTIFTLTYKEAIEKKYIVPVEAYVIDVPRKFTNGSTWVQVYHELVVHNTDRNAQIIDLLTLLHSARKSTLCLVKEVAHGQILSEITGLPFATGQDKESRKYIGQFKRDNIKVLIGTEGIMAEGIDSKPCEYVIIAALGKSKSAFMQKIGRSVRQYPGKESAKVIIFRDNSHKFTKNHYLAQKKILLEEYNAKVFQWK